MHSAKTSNAAGGTKPRRLFYFNAGFLKQRVVRRIVALAGYDLRIGIPTQDDNIAVWGHSPYAARGEAMAQKTGAGIVRIEDAFLRSLFPGRAGEPPIGLMIDTRGIHFDATSPSDIEYILANDPLDDTALLNRARGAMARLQEAHLTKYNAFDPTAPVPDPGYVLVVDQTRGDASITHGRADTNTFREMLYLAQEENPGARIIIKTHPETKQGFRAGYYSESDENNRISLISDAISPYALMEGAVAIYTVSSQMGFEAILMGHKPVVFGQPFYTGWGLTDDRNAHPLPRRGRALTRAQLFAAAMILYPTWYNAHDDCAATLEQAIDAMETRARAWREDHQGWCAEHMRMWKRAPMQAFFGQHRKIVFRTTGKSGPDATGRKRMIWANKAAPGDDIIRIEDGFLRSRGLGAQLIAPLSLVCDDIGIYYDPTCESRLERMIAARADLRPDQILRVDKLRARIISTGISKYNLGGARPELPVGHRILVPGQVEDDASIRLGAGEICTNIALLRAARAANPDAIILYKPHPDVEAGLRAGAIGGAEMGELADMVLAKTDPIALLEEVQEVWTMTSLLGFEALLRGVKVTTTGAPFYAGWGLTTDIGAPPNRRRARPTLTELIHAVLIDYPRYFDPKTGRPSSVEIAVERLATGDIPRPGMGNRVLAKLQGLFASFAYLWR